MSKKKISQRNRTIYYFRGCFNEVDGFIVQKSLEEMITSSWNKLSATPERTFSIENGKSLVGMKIGTETAKLSDGNKDCTLFTVGLYEPGAAASTIPIPSVDIVDLEAETYSAPTHQEYLDAEGFICVYGNHLICSPTDSLRISTINRFIEKLLFDAGFERESALLDVVQIANMDTYKTILKEGVKDITINASLFLETLNYHERHTPSFTQSAILTKIGNMATSCMDMLRDNDNDSDISESDSLNSKIVFSHDGRIKGEESDADAARIVKTARSLIEVPLSGYTIKTKKNNTITHDNIVLRKEVKVTSHGKSVVGSEMWVRLVDTLSSYEKNGTLEQ